MDYNLKLSERVFIFSNITRPNLKVILMADLKHSQYPLLKGQC